MQSLRNNVMHMSAFQCVLQYRGGARERAYRKIPHALPCAKSFFKPIKQGGCPHDRFSFPVLCGSSIPVQISDFRAQGVGSKITISNTNTVGNLSFIYCLYPIKSPSYKPIPYLPGMRFTVLHQSYPQEAGSVAMPGFRAPSAPSSVPPVPD